MTFQPFPWNYLQKNIEMRESFYKTSIAFTQEEFSEQAGPCPGCGKPGLELEWISACTSNESWDANQGKSGFVTCCFDCKLQVSFFVDDELTAIEQGCRKDGFSSAGYTWSETSAELIIE